ncbi:MAG: hypothetical protein HXS44_03040 [Theionarchaea archaeon]|nr:hypothetical protein [Theionarchaea archaeon]
MRRLTMFLVLLLLTLFFLAGCIEQPEEPLKAPDCRDSPFGFHTARMVPTRLEEAPRPDVDKTTVNFYEDAQYIGVTWERPALYCHWIIIQPTARDIENSVYRWKLNDDTYRGIPDALCILGNIGLPERVAPHSWELTESEESYIQFVKAVIERYDGDGIEDMPDLLNPILYWQVENEPDFHGDWQGYAHIQEITYKAIKEACPHCKVVMGGMSGGGIPTFDMYYKNVLTLLKGEYIDIFDFHWYGNAYGDYRGAKDVYATIRETLDDNGYQETDIWITETGTYSGSPFRWEEQPEEDQARDMVKRFIYPLSFGVKRVFWAWALQEGFKHNNGFFDHTGFVYDGEYSDDLGRGKKKLSYYTFKKMTEILEGSDWDTLETLEEGDICILRVLRNGKSIYIIWWDYFHLSYPVKEKEMSLTVESDSEFRLTEVVPHCQQGIDVDAYETAFTTYTINPENGILTFSIGKKPIFLEEIDTDHTLFLLSGWITLVIFVTGIFILKKLARTLFLENSWMRL